MRDTHSVNASCGFVVTAWGRAGIKEPTRCACRITLIGFWAVCKDCGTCYANLREEGYASWLRPVANGKTAL